MQEQQQDYGRSNSAKATFDDLYRAPTPHSYIRRMASLGYAIGERARPFCLAAADLLREENGQAFPVQMLDVGCSYGIGSALVKYGCSFDEMVAFYNTRAPRGFRAACEATRMWLNVTPPDGTLRCVGLDMSEPAIRFAVEAGLLDGGISRDFERTDEHPSDDDRAWFRSCNLLSSTGAIGYVSDRTMNYILRDFGKDHPGTYGPLAVMTILRMFEIEPIAGCFADHGLAFRHLPDIRLEQRRFAGQEEQDKVIGLLEKRGLDVSGWEDRGAQYADLCVAAPDVCIDKLVERMRAVAKSDQGSR